MHILLDMDEVICCFVKRCCDLYNQEHGTSVSPDDVHSFKVTDAFHIGDEKKVDEYMRRYDFYEKMPPIDGAVDGVKKLIDLGHRVTIATSIAKSAPNLYEQKFYWIKRHLPFFDIDDYVGIHRKYKLDGDLLFDDGEHNLNDFYDKRSRGVAVAMDRTWNKNWKGPRVSSWKEFLLNLPTYERWMKV